MNDPRSHENTNSEVEKFFNELGPKRYSHEDLAKFTSNFSESNTIGSGGYGVVYKGQFPNGVQVAVKVLRLNDVVEETFMAEVSTMGNTYHRNLMKLKGYCFEPNMKALVSEYMESGSLDKILYKHGSSIEWEKLYRIAIEIAKGLAYLHDGSDEQIIHYDIKAGNVLLDKNLTPKITDFGLAKLMEKDVSRVPLSRIRGTAGYNAPETWMPGSQVTYKCDVYSFGMMLFEILGKRNNGAGQDWFPGKVWVNFESGNLEHVLNCIGIAVENRENANLMSMVALWCSQFNPEERPTMKKVVLMLEKTIQVEMPPNPFLSWQSSKSSVLPLLEVMSLSEDDLKGAYGIDARTNQDPGSTVSVVQEETQVTIEEGLEGTWKKHNYDDGTIYEGTWKNGLRHGQGKFSKTNGDMYVGEWKDDFEEGKGKYICEDGDYHEGEYKKGVRDGQGKFVHVNGKVYNGVYKNGRLEGQGTIHFPNGNVYDGEFKNGTKEGHGKLCWRNGDEYIGEYRKGKREGHGRYIRAEGEEYIGEFKNGKKEGQGRFVYENGNEYIGEIKNGKYEGQGKFIFKDGSYHEGTYKNGLKDGQGKFVSANRKEKPGKWIQGVRQ